MKATRGGFTLVEVMLTGALLAILSVMVGGVTVGLLRASAREQALAEMDMDANRAMEGLKHIIRAAYIPVAQAPLSMGRTTRLAPTSFAGNVAKWRDVLADGSDMIVFLVAIDTAGVGDVIYGGSGDEKRLILGIDPTGEPAGYREATDEHDTLSNLGIIDVNPVSTFDLPTGVTAIDIGKARFDDTFAFPSGGPRKHVYGVIRFVPFRRDSAVVTVSEAALRLDLNGDNDTGDTFVLGRMELVYPKAGGGVIARSLSGNSVLLQTNRAGNPGEAIFQLVESNTDEGSAIRINLLICNYLEQNNNKTAFSGRRLPLLTRKYESVIKTQLMAAH